MSQGHDKKSVQSSATRRKIEAAWIEEKISFAVTKLSFPNNKMIGKRQKSYEQIITFTNNGEVPWPEDTHMLLDELNSDLKVPKVIFIGYVPINQQVEVEIFIKSLKS